MTDEQSYVQKLGKQPGKIAALVEGRWVYASSRYRELHTVATHEGIEGLPEFMGGAYLRIRDMLWQDTVLALAKLTDKTEQGHQQQHQNLTVRWLPRFCEDTPIHEELVKQIKKINKLAKPVHKWRNQVYAHTELKRTIYPKLQMARLDLQRIRDLLRAIHAPIGTVHTYCIPRSSLASEVLDTDPYGWSYFLGNTLDLVKGARFIRQHIDSQDPAEHTPSIETIREFLRLIGANDGYENWKCMLDFFGAARGARTRGRS